MKIHYLGIYEKSKDRVNDFDYLSPEHKPNAQRPPKLPKCYDLIVGLLNIVIGLSLFVFAIYYGKLNISDPHDVFYILIAAILALLLTYLHEFIHALCMGGDVIMFTSIKNMCLMVNSYREYTKTHYILMNLLPNIILGFIPFIIFLIFPEFAFVGLIGALQISVGIDDYVKVLRCILHLPKGWKIYSHKDGLFWYKPNQSELN